MKKVLFILAVIIMLGISQSCEKATAKNALQSELAEYIKDKDANIGVAVIIDRTDTIEINGNQAFPMLSVYKFPIAVALGNYLRATNKIIPDTLTVTPADLRPDTYSPMRDKYAGSEAVRLPLYEIMAYAMQQSDNNASDILLKIIGGTANAMTALKRLGATDITIASTEAEMHENSQLCYDNSSTPIAMVKLLDRFNYDLDDSYTRTLKQLMETCETGQNRLAKPLSDTNAIIGHKTGTGFPLPDGRLIAVNDVGYVLLPDGRNYSIAVFIENSGYDMAQTEAIIAEISEIVYRHVKKYSK